jgi:hypothetical protein
MLSPGFDLDTLRVLPGDGPALAVPGRTFEEWLGLLHAVDAGLPVEFHRRSPFPGGILPVPVRHRQEAVDGVFGPAGAFEIRDAV